MILNIKMDETALFIEQFLDLWEVGETLERQKITNKGWRLLGEISLNEKKRLLAWLCQKGRLQVSKKFVGDSQKKTTFYTRLK